MITQDTVMDASLRVNSPRSLAGQVAQRLAERIAAVGPHVRLGTKNELRHQVGVSAATLNEALRMLEAQGLVSMKTGPDGGVFAAEPDPMVRIGQAFAKVRVDGISVPHAGTVRDALEPLAVREAAEHRTAAHLRMMRHKMQVVEDSVEDDARFAYAIWDFHRSIYKAGSNEILKSVCLGLIEIIIEHVTELVTKTPEQKQRRIAVHRALLDAIEDQDLQACAAASKVHADEEK